MPAYKLELVVEDAEISQMEEYNNKELRNVDEEENGDDSSSDDEEEDEVNSSTEDEELEDHIIIVNKSYDRMNTPDQDREDKFSETLANKEKQISVDPVSLQQTDENKVQDKFIYSTIRKPRVPPSLPPLVKPKFVSASLPCSASSSPHSGSRGMKKRNDRSRVNLGRQHSASILSRLAMEQQQQGAHLRRSKSCGEGRSSAPSDEFDIFSRRTSIDLHPENGVQVLYECKDDDASSDQNYYPKDRDGERTRDENFKCGALCLYLPGKSRKKHVSSYKEGREQQQWRLPGSSNAVSPTAMNESPTFSRTVSLEKFECGSWSSAAFMDDDDEDAAGIQSYFDLPLELIKGNGNDTDSPVKAAFMFTGGSSRKGVLKKNKSKMAPRMSHESSRHVRFSTSSPSSTCISPRLQKATADFNAFLAAQ